VAAAVLLSVATSIVAAVAVVVCLCQLSSYLKYSNYSCW